MSRKANVDFAACWPWFFLFIGIAIIAFAIYSFISPQTVYDITANAPYASEQDTFLNYLRTPVAGDLNLAELIVKSNPNNDYVLVKTQISELIKLIYGRTDEMCWKLYVDDNVEVKVECKNLLETPLLDAETYVPAYFNGIKRVVKLRLTIPGYVT